MLRKTLLLTLSLNALLFLTAFKAIPPANEAEETIFSTIIEPFPSATILESNNSPYHQDMCPGDGNPDDDNSDDGDNSDDNSNDGDSDSDNPNGGNPDGSHPDDDNPNDDNPNDDLPDDGDSDGDDPGNSDPDDSHPDDSNPGNGDDLIDTTALDNPIYLPLIAGTGTSLKQADTPSTSATEERTENSTDYPPGQWDRIIENKVFTEPLFLGPGNDNTLLINVTFRDIDDHALLIGGVSNVYIKDCLIHDIEGLGIKIRSSEGMSTRNVTIDGCTIYNTERTGVLSSRHSEEGVDHPGLVIKNNTIYNNGRNEHHHNIYVQSTDALIENNILYNSAGNGISVRSSAIVQNNQVWNSVKSCIRYFSDHPKGGTNTIRIENNTCFQMTDTHKDSPGISLLRSGDTPTQWLLDEYYIRFNTIVSLTEDRHGFMVQSSEFKGKYVEFYGNLVVNTEDINKAYRLRYVDYAANNYRSSSLDGFVNLTQEPYDLHLTADSPARGFIAQETHDYPSTDIDGHIRPETNLDAGADQYQTTSPCP